MRKWKTAVEAAFVGSFMGYVGFTVVVGAEQQRLRRACCWSPALHALAQDPDIKHITGTMCDIRRECYGLPSHAWADVQMPAWDALDRIYGDDPFNADTWLADVGLGSRSESCPGTGAEPRLETTEEPSETLSGYSLTTTDRFFNSIPIKWCMPFAVIGECIAALWAPSLTCEEKAVLILVRNSTRLRHFLRLYPSYPTFKNTIRPKLVKNYSKDPRKRK